MKIKKLLIKLHVFIGLFFGPFIFIAALSGAIYAFTFASENWVYQNILMSEESNVNKSLAEQIEVSNKIVGSQGELYSIRPSAARGESSRVLYLDKSLESSQFRTIFINPHTLDVKADIVTYGSGGAMPARMWVDIFHRDLLLGKFGRYYSELAASWMWVTAISGIILLGMRKKKMANAYQLLLNKHTSFGLFSFIALIILSITGLTWSEWAGGNISTIRNELKWHTPGLMTKMESTSSKKYDLTMFDKTLLVARENGIDSRMVEIKPPKKENESWQVAEIDRSYPTQIDAVAINPETLKITDKLEFSKFPLMAKLTRWGIDIHMGTLFGVINQIMVGLMSLGICALVVTGYMLWIKSHGWKFKNTLFKELQKIPRDTFILLGCICLPIILLIPLIFVSLLIFVPLEEYLSRRA